LLCLCYHTLTHSFPILEQAKIDNIFYSFSQAGVQEYLPVKDRDAHLKQLLTERLEAYNENNAVM
jgi:hypothetical protein